MYFENYNGIDGWMIIGDASVVVKSTESSNDHRNYRYQIDRNFSVDNGMEAAKFAEENFQGDWLIGCHVSGFDLEIDAMAFTLRWI